ncbi:hypothetical protein VTK73DRAFT_7296 [Phialemonium thermophilum]|uniref:Uncharacterized protein n=1 Tax=Phialemonium thermophilum TaxID=223376 RepID=A0ABR3WFK8_9PEZI
MEDDAHSLKPAMNNLPIQSSGESRHRYWYVARQKPNTAPYNTLGTSTVDRGQTSADSVVLTISGDDEAAGTAITFRCVGTFAVFQGLSCI